MPKHLVRVPQSKYLQVMAEISDDGCDEIHLADLAEHLDVSHATARRKLDGLIYQKKVVKVSPMIYSLREA